jgi:pyoverdine/dityrosine biosynthesis protein Dit1
MTSAENANALESEFEKLPRGYRIAAKRHDRYNATELMFSSPLAYEVEALPSNDRRLYMPSLEELRGALGTMVRAGHDTVSGPMPPPPARITAKRAYVSDAVMWSYLRWAERDLVYGGPLNALLDNPDLNEAERFLRILCDKTIGHTLNRRHLQLDHIADKLDAAHSERLPIHLVVPSFPFKDQGAFNTEGPPESPDFGEVAQLVRMHCTALALSRVHVEYVSWVVLSDGTLYAPLFELDRGAAITYVKRLQSIRDKLNLRETVSLLSLEDVIDRCGFSYQSDGGKRRSVTDAFGRFTTDIRTVLLDAYNHDGPIRVAIQTLTHDMKWYIDTKRFARHADEGQLWRAVAGRARSRNPLVVELNEHAREAAFRYAASNLALRFSRAIELQFPRSLRATTHAKDGQIALPRTGVVRPWNGVATVTNFELGVESAKTCRLHDAWRKKVRTIYCLEETDTPFFYDVVN